MKNRRGRNLPRVGFTLIEVLLTTVLAAVLLSLLWTLLSMHLRLFESGQTKTEQSQLARTLLKQMSDDVRSVIQAPPVLPPVTMATGMPMAAAPATSSTPAASASSGSKPPAASSNTSSPSPPATAAASPSSPQSSASSNSSKSSSATTPTPNSSSPPASTPPARGGTNGPRAVATTSSLRPAGLFGTETQLQIDILRSTIGNEEDEFDTSRRHDADAPSRAGDLRTVVYTFEEDHDPHRPPGEVQMALVRREIDWEEAHPATRANRGQDGAFPGAALPTTARPSATTDLRTDIVPGQSTEIAPEVVQFGMRYYDGSQWSSEWDSVARKALPVAVEVAIQLRTIDEGESAHHLSGETPHASQEDANVKLPKLPTYRLLIHIPTATRAISTGRGLMGGAGLRDAKPPLGADSHGPRP